MTRLLLQNGDTGQILDSHCEVGSYQERQGTRSSQKSSSLRDETTACDQVQPALYRAVVEKFQYSWQDEK